MVFLLRLGAIGDSLDPTGLKGKSINLVVGNR